MFLYAIYWALGAIQAMEEAGVQPGEDCHRFTVDVQFPRFGKDVYEKTAHRPTFERLGELGTLRLGGGPPRLGPEFRLEGGKSVYGQGIWAPSFRYYAGTFYIFANINNILSAWRDGRMRTPCARADKPEGPYEVNLEISADQESGIPKATALWMSKRARPLPSRLPITPAMSRRPPPLTGAMTISPARALPMSCNGTMSSTHQMVSLRARFSTAPC